MTDLRSELEAWCRSYVAAFEAYDAEQISSHWTFPALTTQADRSFTFKSAEHFASNTARLISFYQAQGVARVIRDVRDVRPLSDHAANMIVADRMLDATGAVIAEWQASYVLQRVAGTWKAVMAVADGEVDAWTARGTPLGG